jgi:hypothetical protein
VSTPNPVGNVFQTQRRSQRILLAVPVCLMGKDSAGIGFSVETQTMIVNAHGALIVLAIPVVVGQSLTIRNLRTQEELACTVVYVNARPMQGPEVGINFASSCPRFWRVAFPPADWSPHSPEAKRWPHQREQVPVGSSTENR